MGRSRLALLIPAILVSVGLALSQAAAFPRKPNFIVVFCDNLGYGTSSRLARRFIGRLT